MSNVSQDALDGPELEAQIKALQSAPPLRVDIQPLAGYFLVAQLQLALRHPLNTGRSADLVRQFAHALQDRLAGQAPLVAAVLEKGWDPAHDFIPGEVGP